MAGLGKQNNPMLKQDGKFLTFLINKGQGLNRMNNQAEQREFLPLRNTSNVDFKSGKNVLTQTNLRLHCVKLRNPSTERLANLGWEKEKRIS